MNKHLQELPGIHNANSKLTQNVKSHWSYNFVFDVVKESPESNACEK